MNKKIIPLKAQKPPKYYLEWFELYKNDKEKNSTEWYLTHLLLKHSSQVSLDYYMELLSFLGYWSPSMKNCLNIPHPNTQLHQMEFWMFVSLGEYYLDNNDLDNKLNSIYKRGNEIYQTCDECNLTFFTTTPKKGDL
ncbi:hypothetical protein [Mycoplasma seminis]|uniref:Uncharacterized protein n=1 Tax=Mycoplasma seminis TaxID=512749 RepID=A0ABY9HC39_9MOLU|nr:hypothetical protein [Mycoplasma seminis]WLP85248.1 hypothetical protein Q8852_02910 [Mycoplasma seminis]